MVTLNRDGYLVGLSSDVKPTGYDNGFILEEMDTGNIYRYDAQNKVWICPVTLLISIAVTTPPTTTTYFEGHSFDPTGMVVKGTYGDGTTKEITGYTITPTTFSSTDTKVTISYGGKTCEQAVTITPLAVESIAVVTAPTKTAYTTGETLTMEGLSIGATLNDETVIVLPYGTEGVTYSPAEGTEVSASGNVTITYATKTCTQAITFS